MDFRKNISSVQNRIPLPLQNDVYYCPALVHWLTLLERLFRQCGHNLGRNRWMTHNLASIANFVVRETPAGGGVALYDPAQSRTVGWAAACKASWAKWRSKPLWRQAHYRCVVVVTNANKPDTYPSVIGLPAVLPTRFRTTSWAGFLYTVALPRLASDEVRKLCHLSFTSNSSCVTNFMHNDFKSNLYNSIYLSQCACKFATTLTISL